MWFKANDKHSTLIRISNLFLIYKDGKELRIRNDCKQYDFFRIEYESKEDCDKDHEKLSKLLQGNFR